MIYIIKKIIKPFYLHSSCKKMLGELKSDQKYFSNPLQPGVALLYPLKNIFRGYRKETPGCNGLNKSRNPEEVFLIAVLCFK